MAELTEEMCPHCGELLELKDELIPYHDWPRPGRMVCPGSGQIPRNPESDARPLWNGHRNPHFRGGQPMTEELSAKREGKADERDLVPDLAKREGKEGTDGT